MFEACDQQQQQGQMYKGQVRRLHKCAGQWKCIAHQCQSHRLKGCPLYHRYYRSCYLNYSYCNVSRPYRQ